MDANKSITAVFTNTVFAGGNGTEDYPYQVSTLEQLQAVNDYPDKHFIQINDIDASVTSTWNEGEGFTPLGDDIVNFKGSYDGNEKSILNLFINRPNYENIGLFGYVGSGASLNNVNLEAVNITGLYSVGGLVGFIEEGSIVNSSVSGEVNATGRVGGLVGWNRYKVVVNHSSSSARIEGNGTVGGLVGSNYTMSEILNSFATGAISGVNSVGGLVGQNFFAEIDKSYMLLVM